MKLNALCSAISFHYFTLISKLSLECRKKKEKRNRFSSENYYFYLLFRAFAATFRGVLFKESSIEVSEGKLAWGFRVLRNIMRNETKNLSAFI